MLGDQHRRSKKGKRMSLVKCEACYNNHQLTPDQIKGLLGMAMRGELHRVVGSRVRGQVRTQIIPICVKDVLAARIVHNDTKRGPKGPRKVRNASR